MLANDCHDLINKSYPDPTFKAWEPSEYDLKYKFKQTKAGQRKLAAQREKEDSKLKDAYDREIAEKKHVHFIIDEISTYPSEVAALFLDTFKWTIEDIVRKHDAYLKAKEDLLNKWGKEISDNIWNLKYLLEEKHWESSWTGHRGRYVTWILADVEDIKQHEWTNRSYCKEFSEVKDRKDLFKDYKTIQALRDADDVYSMGTEAYPMAIKRMTETLSRILSEIKKIFGDNKPTKCLTDASWGKDMHFNGLLTDGTKKVNFLSFGAGGHNIQRFHYRFKISELKS